MPRGKAMFINWIYKGIVSPSPKGELTLSIQLLGEIVFRIDQKHKIF